MSKNLVIVESPAKAKTINKYLGNDFEVIASYGHVRDLVPKEGAVDTDSFEMKYENVKRNKKYIDAIYQSAKNTSNAIYLATDPDREGEAISWHIYELLKKKKLVNSKKVYRVAFNEVTKDAVSSAIGSPGQLSQSLIDAQQARRALDYLVGFNLSPLLWKKIKPGLSAGRVQSPALRMIVEREKEIEAFKPQEFWSMDALCVTNKQSFKAGLTHFKGEKVKQFFIENKTQSTKIREVLLQAANGKLTASKVETKKRKRNPQPPFTTSTLQQDASRKLGFSAKKTMMIAQQLYEGIDIGKGEVGLITYMRTDSVNLSGEAINQIRTFISTNFEAPDLPAKPNYYRTKSKNAQEAHEAIRPTSADRTPANLMSRLSKDQFRLYELIWKRAIACQMSPAQINILSIDFNITGGHNFRATGSTIAYPGYLKVYHIGRDDNQSDDTAEKLLPHLKEGDTVDLEDILAEQHFTKPPARFSEALLIKTLEEYGIGRPSTYASIISTLLSREYVTMEQKRFFPTDIGRIVNKFLNEYFPRYVEYAFTARLEDRLDDIARGEAEWKPLMKEFWKAFKTKVDETEKIPRNEINKDRILGTDPKSGKPLSVRMARYGAVAQIGSRDDEEKPQFASLRPGQNLETITLEEALELFKLPRTLGTSPEGETITAAIGRFGPYVKIGKSFVSIKGEDPHAITLERALEIIKEHAEKEKNKIIKEFKDENIQVLNGRYGPYITNGQKNARIVKGTEPADLTLAECQELLDKAPAKGKARARRKKKQ